MKLSNIMRKYIGFLL